MVCEHFGICGGCTLLDKIREEQLEYKANLVKGLLRPVCIGDIDGELFEGIKASPRQFGYRNKMEFSFGDAQKDGPLCLGMHKRRSFHDIVTVTGCQIVDEDYRQILSNVWVYFRDLGVSYFHKKRHIGYLRHLLVRKGANTGEILIDLITSTQMEEEQEKILLEGFKGILLDLKLEGEIVGILHTRNDRLGDVVFNQGTDVLHGRDYFFEEILGLEFKITPFSFFQTNSLGAEVLYETVREYIGPIEKEEAVVYDLYSGTGTIAQVLAGTAKKIIGVELVEEAVEAAKENAKRNGLDSCEFAAGDVLKVLDDLDEKPDYIILDPPRSGVHAKALGKIVDYGVDSMVYVSCKPISLARDLDILQEGGYRAKRICCVDLFPGSENIETVVLLSREMENCL